MNILDEIAAKTCERTEAEKKKVPLEMVRRIAEEKAAAEKAAGNGKFSYRFQQALAGDCLLYTSPSPRDSEASRMPSSA